MEGPHPAFCCQQTPLFQERCWGLFRGCNNGNKAPILLTRILSNLAQVTISGSTFLWDHLRWVRPIFGMLFQLGFAILTPVLDTQGFSVFDTAWAERAIPWKKIWKTSSALSGPQPSSAIAPTVSLFLFCTPVTFWTYFVQIGTSPLPPF